jgi:hypothetical protein
MVDTYSSQHGESTGKTEGAKEPRSQEYWGTAVLERWSVGALGCWSIRVFVRSQLISGNGIYINGGIAKKSFDHNVRKIELEFRRRKSSTLKAQT